MFKKHQEPEASKPEASPQSDETDKEEKDVKKQNKIKIGDDEDGFEVVESLTSSSAEIIGSGPVRKKPLSKRCLYCFQLYYIMFE